MPEEDAIQLSVIQDYVECLRQATAVSKIHKGYSFDGKYLIYESSSETPVYVLRTAPLKQLERKRGEFEAVRHVYALGVKTSEPIAFGTMEPHELCYMVLRYVEGEDAFDVLPSLTEEEQYRIGLTAGRELRLMHQLEAAADLQPWHIRQTAKYHRQFTGYRDCGIKLPEEDTVVAFINDHLPLMAGRPNRFQHDDFHASNLLVHNRRYAAAIDFNRFDWGDPYHDFLKIAYFSREASIPFCIGQIHGYFDGNIPEHFWQLYALYTAIILFPSITWTLKVVPHQLDSMLARIRIILEDHRNFESVVPSWYTSNPIRL
ncbi:aminoglycoside phosphotransferase family protein [Paenibacillus allorhizosphaerae]|uniref:Aminoglycoside phosphotransferase domain-containing protein n=1 Tax=Paenibacillus allorhizosphaerae TaxID=2849866 RepID=A0ABN7TFG7_9BACL|nr:aminoglycoside phosphotransferase family protein [Paenibacillus allorhizosphaerae]CAG7626512.1 hypothetical protein PAECIP111802_01258 [Paenibacillus allorhizosphaerae]